MKSDTQKIEHFEVTTQEERALAHSLHVQHGIGYREGFRLGLPLGLVTGAIVGMIVGIAIVERFQ